MNTTPVGTTREGQRSRLAVTEDDVRAACAKLISEKQPVSHRSVRAAMGRGSFSTIGRILLEIKAKDTHSAQAPEVRELFEELWGLAFAKAKSEAAKDVDELRSNLQEALNEIGRMELVEEESVAKVAAANASKDQALSELTRAQDNAQAARAQAMEALSETAKAVHEVTSLKVELSALGAAKEEALKQAQDRFVAFKAESDARIKRLDSDLESARSEINRASSENAGLRERLDFLKGQREADLSVHRDEVSDLRKENAALQGKMEELRVSAEKRVQEAQSKVEGALRDQATLADTQRRELAGLLEKVSRPGTPKQ